ncbi:MAG: N-acetyl-gamma-glutamyl-phosphate reductase [Spirochaetaceae bacterium]
MNVAILGATGYTGALLLRILSSHPEVESIIAVSSSRTGEEIGGRALSREARKKLALTGGSYVSYREAREFRPRAVFSALPHLRSAELCEPFLPDSVVIDLSADFRHKDTRLFERAYGAPPPRTELLGQAVYGLTEHYREQLRTTDLIGTPGCYPTCVLLPLLPLAGHGLPQGTVIIHAMSGVSGAGRKAKENLLFAERTENVNAYSPGTSHRHLYEIEEQLRSHGAFGGPGSGAGPRSGGGNHGPAPILFTPHLVPIKQGMAATITIPIPSETVANEAIAMLHRRYEAEPFVEVVTERIPETIEVRGTNRALISYRKESGYLMLFSVIDNLWKGASGQAVQNFNVRFGFDESAGLRLDAEV